MRTIVFKSEKPAIPEGIERPMKRILISGLLLLCCCMSLRAQRAFDTLLFKIPLVSDTASPSLFSCPENCQIRKTLAGPVVMQDNHLLFYSENGYLLYDQRGAVIDSHSVFDKNRGLPHESHKRIILAFPVDNTTILYYQKMKSKEYPLTIFEKKIFKNRLKPVKEKEYPYYLGIENGQIFNLAHNSITDDMANTFFVLPQLIGFTSVTGGNRWWSVDKFYTFSSPVINESEGKCKSFFPGIRDVEANNRLQLINPIQVFLRDNNWYIAGIYATAGAAEDRYNQTFYVFDPAGNILYADPLLKLANKDVIIGEDAETYYTVKKVESFVFQPGIDIRGNLYYGVINYIKKDISVHKRGYYGYRPSPSEPNLAHLIDIEKQVIYAPLSLPCNMRQPVGKTIPDISMLDERGSRIKAAARHLSKGEYLVRISRSVYRDLDKKLSKGRSDLPEAIRSIQDSLYNVATISCPYAISLSGPKGMIRSFNYPADAVVHCARILALRDSGEVLVRVDCEQFAEILMFSAGGAFTNRFIFNRQNYKERKDIVVAADKSPVVELDYESDPKKGKFFQWDRVIQ